MPYSSGFASKNVFRYGPEVHKLHLEFKVATDSGIRTGMPVVLDPAATTERTVKAFDPATDVAANIIGYAIADGKSAYGSYIVVAVRGYAVVEAVAGTGDVVPGPVLFESYVAQGDASQPLDLDDDSGQSQTGTPAQVGSSKYEQTAMAGANFTDAELLLSNGWALTAGAANAAILVLLK